MSMIFSFKLHRRDIANRFQQPAVIKPVGPFQSSELNIIQALPRTAVADELGLEQADDGLGQGVVITVPSRTHRADGTGIRRNELIDLNVDTVRLTERMFRVKGKGEKERLVFFGPKLARKLRRYIGLRSTLSGIAYQEALFVTSTGERLKPRNVHQIVSRLGKKAGITGVRCSPHTLRHTFATRYIANGGDPYALQELLGHSDPKTTMVYVHMTGKRLKEAFAKADPLGDIV